MSRNMIAVVDLGGKENSAIPTAKRILLELVRNV